MEVAAQLRDEGVKLFTADDFVGALPKFKGAYEKVSTLPSSEDTMSLQLSCLLNMASCCVKTGAFDDAVGHSTAALEINKKSYKALFRRGQARRQLKQFSKARIDLVMAMELTDDPAVKAELDLLRQEQGVSAASDKKSEVELYQNMMAPRKSSPVAPPSSAPPPVAVQWTAEMEKLRATADSGSVDAQFELGECFDNGTKGFPKDAKESFKYYSLASDQGHATAKRYCAWCHKTGTGVAADASKAITLYRECVEANRDIKAAACLGYCFDKGDGVTEDAVEAIKWYTIAAEQNDSVAQVNLALCYEKGRGTEKNLPTALQWYRRAAEQGNLNAFINVGLYYEKGDGGLEKNMPEAFKWYRNAALKGDPTGMAVTGWCYERGEGVSMDKAEAMQWYTKGAMKGHHHAKEGLRRLMKESGDLQ